MGRARMRRACRRLREALRTHGGQLAYYGGIALALAAIAFAAERYRGEREAEPQAPSLPAVEFAPPAEEAEKVELRMPADMELLRGYSEVPLWNAALGQWESHAALDYQVAGGAVESLSAGVVRAVGKSGAYGGFVEVDCGEILLRYASILPREGLEPGDELEPGEEIGTADASLPGELGLGPHLHLEAVAEGRAVDYSSLAAGD